MFTQLNGQTVLFLTIQFSISYLFAHSLKVRQFYFTHRENLSGFITLGQSRPGSDRNEGLLSIPQGSRTRALPSDNLISYQRHSFVVGDLTALQKCSCRILLPKPTWLIGPCAKKKKKKTLKNNYTKNVNIKYNKCDSKIFWHKITPYRLTCH